MSAACWVDPNATEARLNALIEVMKTETVDGQTIIDNPVFRDRLMQLRVGSYR